jgi:hypothetical protein
VRVWGRASGNASVSSLFGYASGIYELTKVIEDESLSATQVRSVATEALARGAEDARVEVEFDSTDRYLSIGAPVFVDVSSLAEPSAQAITGTLVAHDVVISGFGKLTERRGPSRAVRASKIRRPTMWQVLRGD